MKIAVKKKPTIVVAIIVLVCIVVAALAVWWVTRQGPEQAAQQNVSQPPVVSEEKPVTAPVVVQLSDTLSVTALVENYDVDNSLWRVVSKDFPLTDQHYTPADLVLVTFPNPAKSREENTLRNVAQKAANDFLGAGKVVGHDMMVASGFRSYELQQTYFSNYVRSYGEAAANQFSARPGQSEHQTGLAFDIATTDRKCYLEECFSDTPAGAWAATHAHEYGLILRYPKGKETTTKYTFEPWHFRYVGVEFATALHTTGLTLDEARPALQVALQELKRVGQISQ